MFECVTEKLLEMKDGKKQFIFDTLCWANNNPSVPITKLAEEIIKILPKLQGDKITVSQISTMVQSSRKGYKRGFQCYNQFHCKNMENCKFVDETPIEILLHSTKGPLISFIPDKELKFDIYQIDKKGEFTYFNSVIVNTKKFEIAGKQSDMCAKLVDFKVIEKEQFNVFQAEVLRRISDYNADKELQKMLKESAIKEKQMDYFKELEIEAEKFIKDKDIIGLARSYFMLSLGGTPYRALLMWLSHLLTISNIDYSPYIIANGTSGAGKSTETERSLEAIDKQFVIQLSGLTEAAMKARGREDKYYYDRKIVNFGDKGGKYDDDNMAVVVSKFKQLWSEGQVAWEQSDKEDIDKVIRTELLGHPSICYTTVNFSADIDEQEIGRGFNFNIVKNQDIIRMHTECIDVHRYAQDKWSKSVREILPLYERALQKVSRDIYDADLNSIQIKKMERDYLKNKIPSTGDNQERLYILMLEISRVIAWLKGESFVSSNTIEETYTLVSTTTVNAMEISDAAKILLQTLVNFDKLDKIEDLDFFEEIREVKTSLKINLGKHLFKEKINDSPYGIEDEDLLLNPLIWSRTAIEKMGILSIKKRRLNEVLKELVESGYLVRTHFDKDNANYYYVKDTNAVIKTEKPKIHKEEYFPDNKRPHYSIGRRITNKNRRRVLPPSIPGRRLE